MPVLTLSTDIGQKDFIAGAVKGQLLTADPLFTIADITHQLSPQNFMQAAYICGNAFKHYPDATCHIIILSFFEIPPAHWLIAEHNRQFIACPDNGILTMITGQKPANVVAIEIPPSEILGLLHCTRTLSLAIKKIYDTLILNDVGKSITDIIEKYPLRSAVGTNWIDSQVIFIDNFENVVINITKEEFEHYRAGRKFKIIFTRNEAIDEFSQNYASVVPGEKLAWFNSAGYLEIAINKGNLAGMFGLQGFSESAMQNKLLYQTVRIFFD